LVASCGSTWISSYIVAHACAGAGILFIPPKKKKIYVEKSGAATPLPMALITKLFYRMQKLTITKLVNVNHCGASLSEYIGYQQ